MHITARQSSHAYSCTATISCIQLHGNHLMHTTARLPSHAYSCRTTISCTQPHDNHLRHITARQPFHAYNCTTTISCRQVETEKERGGERGADGTTGSPVGRLARLRQMQGKGRYRQADRQAGRKTDTGIDTGKQAGRLRL